MTADPRLNPKTVSPGVAHQVTAPLAGIHKEPREDSTQLTQALLGERLEVFEMAGDWAYVRLTQDGYAGYARKSQLSERIVEPTHRVRVPATLSFPAANIKSQPAMSLPMNAQVAVIAHDEKFAQTPDGRFIYTAHLQEIGAFGSDYVDIAGKFLHVPYLWGGKSVAGLDCSGLVQLSLQACGIDSRRDSDMQEEEFGEPVLLNDLDGARRGDLVFWSGHVGIMEDSEMMLHANGFHMMVVREPLREAVERIGRLRKQVTSVRRRQ